MMSISNISRRYIKLALVFALFVPMAYAVPVTPIVQPHVTFVNGAGMPCVGCKLSTYGAGTTTPLATYTDATGTSVNSNPIILDAAGGAQIWLGSNSYKFVLKDALGNTIWTVDSVNAASLFPCGPANAIQAANSAVNGLTCDSQITINTTTHVLSAHAIITSSMLVNGVTVGPLGTPTTWNFDTTTPATAAASLGVTPGSVIDTGTINQLAFYAAAGTELSGTSAIPAGITVTTQTPSDNSTNPASTAYVALPGAINPTSVKIASGVAMTDNQGNGAKIQHSTGTTTTGDLAVFDANGNVIDGGTAGKDYNFSFTGCTIPTGANAQCQSTINFTTSTTPTFTAFSDAIYVPECVADGGTVYPNISINFTFQGLTSSGFGYTLGASVDAFGVAQTPIIYCHAHHN
jgi:hypothetical protein